VTIFVGIMFGLLGGYLARVLEIGEPLSTVMVIVGAVVGSLLWDVLFED
jgi:uncharacterized membrane protein YeaQ/YmgE (transglycosylase-associated protein family)